jgi:hypothetical protein
MHKSDELRTFVQNLEQQFDEASDAMPTADPNPLDTLSVDALIGDVESFLRTRSDIPGTGADGEPR